MKWSGIQFQRLRLISFFQSYPIVALKVASYLLCLIGITIIVLSLITALSQAVIALAILMLVPGIIFYGYSLYIRYLIDHPWYGISAQAKADNQLEGFDYESLKALIALKQKCTWAALWDKLYQLPEASLVLFRLGLTKETSKSLIAKEAVTNEVLEQFVRDVARDAARQPVVTIYHLLHQLMKRPEVSRALEGHHISQAEIAQLLHYYKSQHEVSVKLHDYWTSSQLVKTGGFGKDWAVSYTATLDQFTYEVPPSIYERTLFTPLLGREELVTKAITELGRSQGQNILLVGEEGSGRTEVFYHLAAKLMTYQTKTDLDGVEIRQLSIERLLSSVSSSEQLQQLLDQIFADLRRSGRVILFIDQIDSLLDPTGKFGTIDTTAVLAGYINNPNVHLIGAISEASYLSVVKGNKLLSQSFSRIEVPSPAKTDMPAILLSHLPQYERRYQVFVLYEALLELIELAERYVKDSSSPARELALLEAVTAETHARGKKVVQADDVIAIVEQQSGVPIQVGEKEQELLLNLDERLHQRVVGQDLAISQVSDALLRARAGLSSSARPIGTFLFLGPTGVGKTETAKALAEVYFGSTEKLVRLDMSEYADATALQKLLGVDEHSQAGSLTLAIAENPSCVLLLDELEKASAQVKNVLLQLLDEGRLTTNFGKKLDFTNAIIIATSNAGSNVIADQVARGLSVKDFDKQLIDWLISSKVFSPELINRFDGVILFSPLVKSETEQIVQKELALLGKRLQQEKGITLQVSPAVTAELARRGYDPVFGARALQRTIKNDLETSIAREIISQKLTSGSTLVIENL